MGPAWLLPNCGNLVLQAKGPGQLLCVGAFDDSPDFDLCGEIYIDEKPSGYDFASEHSRMTGAEFMASIDPVTAQAEVGDSRPSRLLLSGLRTSWRIR